MTYTFILSTYPANGSTINVPRPTVAETFNKPFGSSVGIVSTVWLSKTNPDPQLDANALTTTLSPQLGSGTFSRGFGYQTAWPSLSQGLWYYRFTNYHSTTVVDSTITGSFTVAYNPAVTPVLPVSGNYVPFVAGASNVSHSWTFASPDETDYQTAYQLKVYLAVSPFTVYYDSGKVASGAAQAFSTIAAAQKNTLLEWSVDLWSRTDTKSLTPATGQFRLADPSTVNITAPTESSAVTTGNIDVTFTPTCPAGITIKTLILSVWKGGTQVWTKTVTGSWASAGSINITDTNFGLENLAAYYYRVAVIDTNNLTSADAVRNFTTNYAVPATPTPSVTVTTTLYNTSGYNSVTWPGTPRDTDFLAWQIERRDNMVDPDTGDPVSPLNELSNSSFEVNTTGWSASRGTFDRTAGVDSPSGSFNGSYVSTDASTPEGNLVGSNFVPVVAGQVFTASAFIKAQVQGTQYRIRLLWWNGAAFVGTSDFTSAGDLSGSVYTRLSVTGTAPAGTVSVGVEVNAVEALAIGAGFNIDAAMITRGSTLHPYVDGGTADTGWNVIGRSYAITSTVEYRDFLAPANYFHEYRIKQVALKFGGEVFSVNGITGTGTRILNPYYWLLAGVNGDSTTMFGVRIYNVVGDTSVDEMERAEFVLIGRGRYSETGTDLGVRGQLTLNLRNGEGVTARLKKQVLEDFKKTYSRAYLRNAFGDVYIVSVGDMSISRIAGVGSSEFCDVTIPYVESVS